MTQSRIFAAILATILLTCTTGMTNAQPSFDCTTAKTFREKAVCRDRQLAGLDRDIARAFASALARSDLAGAAALRKDQRTFLTGIDDGFDRLLYWGHSTEATEDELNEALKNREGAVAGLADELKRRLDFLKSLEPGRQTPIGTWQNASTRISVTPQKHTFIVGFDASTFGWTRYNCQFEAGFVMRDGVLRADAAKNLDVDQDYYNQLTLRQRNATLELREIVDEKKFNGWTCPHRPELREVLFAVRSAQ